ncbi:MAG: Cobalamin synthesis protein P47K [Succiniclasticum sp.]|jgi:G3E family GTPase
MNVLVVSGFLGAGKTTFLTRLVRHLPDRDFAILENEFGETDIDAKIIGQDVNPMKIWEVTENCVCCTGKADFLTNLLTISSALDPEVLLVEPTGVARLGNIIRNVEGLGYDRIRMLPPLAMVDVHAFQKEKDAYDEIYWDQIAHSDTIVLTKSEDWTEAELAPIIAELRKKNPHADIVSGDYSTRDTAWWNHLLEPCPDTGRRPAASPPEHEHHHHDGEEPGLRTVTLHEVELPSPVALLALLQDIAGGRYGALPRAKGCLPCHTPGEWIRFDLVDQRWMISGFPPQDRPTVTLIGEEFDEEGIRQYFASFHKP